MLILINLSHASCLFVYPRTQKKKTKQNKQPKPKTVLILNTTKQTKYECLITDSSFETWKEPQLERNIPNEKKNV